MPNQTTDLVMIILPRSATGLVFNIQKFSIHDGPGIRTTVFLKGCPLKCVWCHNPESQDRKPEISFLPEKCIGCGWCFEACPNNCHKMVDGKHVFNREQCDVCGKCAENCYAEAIELIGKEMTVDEVIEEVMKDAPFYETSNGGMTISGGEPMMQFEFTKALLMAAKENGVHTCLDTCGFAPFEKYRQIMPYVDIFLYDLKETDSAKHEEFTRAPREEIMENLKKLDSLNAKIILRCPVIPGLNDRRKHLVKIAETAESLKNVICINIQPYHPLGVSKNASIGKKKIHNDMNFASEELIEASLETIKKHTSVKVEKG